MQKHLKPTFIILIPNLIFLIHFFNLSAVMDKALMIMWKRQRIEKNMTD